MSKTIDSTGREYTGRVRAHQERRRAQVCFLMDQELFDEILNQCRVGGCIAVRIHPSRVQQRTCQSRDTMSTETPKCTCRRSIVFVSLYIFIQTSCLREYVDRRTKMPS